MALFSNKQEANLRSVAKMVEGVIASLNLSAEQSRVTAENAAHAWGIMKGSAQVFIFVHAASSEEDWHSIQVISPVLRLPESGPHQMTLLRHLLDLNARELAGAAFGLNGDTVVITASRSTEDLDSSEVKDMILKIGYYADHYDDILIGQFGGSRQRD
jgi:hypothetical protein